MKLFRTIASLFAVAALSAAAFAQNPAVFGGVANAYDFAYGLNPKVAPLQVDMTSGPTPASSTATLTVAFGQISLGDGTVITPLSTHAPITVGTGANQETVTPSAVSCTTPQIYQSCSFTAAFTYSHGTGDRIASASYGVAEAQNYVTGKWGGGLVAISPQLLKNAGVTYTHAAINTFITGIVSASATAIVLDWSGVSVTATGALSYQNAVGSDLASTTHVIY